MTAGARRRRRRSGRPSPARATSQYGRLQIAAPCQHQRGRVAGEPPLVAGVRVPVQRSPGIVERPDQPADRLPGRRSRSRSALAGAGPAREPAGRPARPRRAGPAGGSVPGQRAMARPQGRPSRREPPKMPPVTLSAPRPAARRGGQRLHPPGVDVVHRPAELVGEVAAGQVDIAERRLARPVPGERRDGVQFPAHPGQVGQAQVPGGMRGEPLHPGINARSAARPSTRSTTSPAARSCGATPTGTAARAPG